MEPRIKKLSEELVAKIAAGEVITAPVNVVKELVENSLDAKATLIHISIRDKGTCIKVRDNGIGFNKDDLPIACMRHTTSKLRSMDDFETLENYGFRGEALSSISQVSEVTIITKKRTDQLGSQAIYKDGQMISCNNIAANDGTVISIKNLFYNFKERKVNLMANFTKEYNEIIHVIQCYAIHCNLTSFHLDKDDRPDVLSIVDKSKIEMVKQVLGSKIASNLLELNFGNSKYDYSFNGIISNTDTTLTRYVFILFINNRLVDCSVLEKMIREIYTDQIMKKSNPFVYLNLSISQKNIDVNLHPSKREVRYLNEDVINAEICSQIQRCLIEKAENQDILKMNHSFTMNKSLNNSLNCLDNSIGESINNQIQRPTAASSISTPKTSSRFNDSTNYFNQQASNSNSNSKSKNSRTDSNKIRNDSSSRKITDMFALQKFTEDGGPYRYIKLKSVFTLRNELDVKKNIELTYKMKKLTLVGVLDHRRILVQHEEYVNMLDFVQFSKTFFYQYYLKNFGNFKIIRFTNKLKVSVLLEVFRDELGLTHLDGFNISENIASLIEKRNMFADYFRMMIDDDGYLLTIPIIVDGHKPNLNLLPLLIWNLTSVIYNEEKECFKMIGEAFANFYSRPLDNLEEQKKNINAIFSRFKEEIKPGPELASAIKPIDNVQQLYKIFERC